MSKSIKISFYERVLLPNEDGCMLWIGGKSSPGYGAMRNSIKAHRYSYELHYGKFDKKLFVCHKCDNPLCVAPDHLFLGTQTDNMRDMTIKKRNFIPNNPGEYNGQAKLSSEKVKEIKMKISQGYLGYQLAKEYKISKAQISRIKNNKKWQHINI